MAAEQLEVLHPRILTICVKFGFVSRVLLQKTFGARLLARPKGEPGGVASGCSGREAARLNMMQLLRGHKVDAFQELVEGSFKLEKVRGDRWARVAEGLDRERRSQEPRSSPGVEEGDAKSALRHPIPVSTRDALNEPVESKTAKLVGHSSGLVLSWVEAQ